MIAWRRDIASNYVWMCEKAEGKGLILFQMYRLLIGLPFVIRFFIRLKGDIIYWNFISMWYRPLPSIKRGHTITVIFAGFFVWGRLSFRQWWLPFRFLHYVRGPSLSIISILIWVVCSFCEYLSRLPSIQTRISLLAFVRFCRFSHWSWHESSYQHTPSTLIIN